MGADEGRTRERARSEILIWMGFGIVIGACFLAILFVPDLTVNQMVALFTMATCAGFVNHGFLDRAWVMVGSGLVGIAVTAVSLVLSPAYSPLGWILLGIGLILTGPLEKERRDPGHVRSEHFVGLCIIIGGSMQLIAGVSGFGDLSAVWMVWMVLTGVIFLSIGRATRNVVIHYFGIAWVILTVVLSSFAPEYMLPGLGLLFVVGILANFVHLYRLLGRTPKIGELLSFAGRALFLRGLTKPISHYRIIAVLITGGIAAHRVIGDLISKLGEEHGIVLLLGPTAPSQVSPPQGCRTGWVTTVSASSGLQEEVIAPEDLTGVRVFLDRAVKDQEGSRPVIIGDFLDNMLPQMTEDVFHRFYSDLSSSVRVTGLTIILVVNSDIHSEVKMNTVRRFADVVIENRELEEGGRLRTESRVVNLIDDVSTDWERG